MVRATENIYYKLRNLFIKYEFKIANMLFARYSNKILLFIVSPFLCMDINLVTLVMLGTVILVCITVYHPRGHVVPFAVALLCPL